jgi:hypothetical protein
MAMTAGLILVGWIGLAQQASLGQSISESGWRKHTINDRSPYEAAGAADFNKDGKIDVFSGDSWYAAPDWVRHQVREVPNVNPHYHEDFADLPMDVNGDGRMDIITCSYFSKRIAWIENPADPTQRWTEHTVDTPGSMETGYLVDINDDGQRDFLPNIGSTVAWYEIVSKKPEVKWKKYDLGKDGRGHGIGAGFVNSDSYMDIVTPKGWYEQPTDYKTPWSFHAEFDLGAASIPIIVRDLDGDGDSDILWGMGHDFGLFWMTQAYGSQGQREWTKQRIDASFSQVHTLHLADVDGDRISEIITGKRVYAHEAEPGATDAPCLYQFKLDRAQSRWIKQVIYEGKPAANAPPPEEKEKRSALNDFERGSAGTGLLLESIDLDKDGDLDLICPGKSGLYWFENLRVTNSRSASSPR